MKLDIHSIIIYVLLFALQIVLPTSQNLDGENVSKSQPWYLLNVSDIWSLGYCGENVRVGVFDTGISNHNKHFRTTNLMEETDWTSKYENDGFYQAVDGHGHGTFVSALIAGSIPEGFEVTNLKSFCPVPGLSPAVDLYIYRVFTDNQISYTSWFLDAFNYAISRKMHVINLSIGGPDFLDTPFVEKVQELSANGVLLVSAIGNDGPFYGGLNNPGDQIDVLSVGGIDNAGEIASFSSRGMTGWELSQGGYGRVKPDIVTWSSNVMSAKLGSDTCKLLSGTSVASPIVTGAVSLLVDAVIKRKSLIDLKHRIPLNPASIRQSIIAGALRLGSESGVGNPVSMYEQGAGLLNIERSIGIAIRLKPQPSVFPSYIDLTDCPYMWPHCTQPLYATSLPVVMNLTILNSMAVTGKIIHKPVYHPIINKNGHWLKVKVSYPEILWPWSGWIGIEISIDDELFENDLFSGNAEGYLTFIVTSRNFEGVAMNKTVKVPIRVPVIPIPPKSRRLLWDQFRNVKYPPAYIPKDDLESQINHLDWLGDHIHTNYKDLYAHLRKSNYYVETSVKSLTCVNLSHYGTIIIVDPEKEFLLEENENLVDAVKYHHTSLIILADWYNRSISESLRFYDSNTQRWWLPDACGSNLPALNSFLEPFDIEFGSNVYAGDVNIGEKSFYFNSGAGLTKLPDPSKAESLFLQVSGLKLFSKDLQSKLVLNSLPKDVNVPILAFVKYNTSSSGRIAVFGDSNCVDSVNINTSKGCKWIFNSMLLFTTSKTGRIYKKLFESSNFMSTKVFNYSKDWFSDIPSYNVLNKKLHKTNRVPNKGYFNDYQKLENALSCYSLSDVLVSPLTTNINQYYGPQHLDLYPPEYIAKLNESSVCSKLSSMKTQVVYRGETLFEKWWEYVLALIFFTIAIFLLFVNCIRSGYNRDSQIIYHRV